MNFELPFFTNLLILLVTAKVFGEILERFKQPAMIGEIMAGMVLGPSLLNIINPTQEVTVISELGIFLLVILAGLEINVEDILKSLKGKSLIISIMAFFVPLLSGIAVGHFFGLRMMTTMFVGLCIAITALPVSIRILMDLGKLNSVIGQKIISVAIFDDVIALSILGVLLNLNSSNMSMTALVKVGSLSFFKLVCFIAVLSLGYVVLKKISLKGSFVENTLNKFLTIIKGKESLFALFFAFILLFSSITEALGFHFIIGAFFASMLLNESILGKENLENIEKTTSSLAMGFLAPIFFASIGLEFDISAIHNTHLLAAIVLVSYLSKIMGGFLGSSFAGLGNKVSLVMGFGLNARGIMELVIANIAYKAGLINAEIFSILVIMGVLTTITTPIMLKWGFGKIESKT